MAHLQVVQVEQAFTNESTINVNHNKNTIPDKVVILDDNWVQVIPTSIINTDGNNTQIVLPEAKTGKVILDFNEYRIVKGLTEYKIEVNDTDDGLKITAV